MCIASLSRGGVYAAYQSLTFLGFCFFWQGLLGPMGLLSSNLLEQEAAINSLSTLMTMTPEDTYTEFSKVCCHNICSFRQTLHELWPIWVYLFVLSAE